MFPDGGQRTGPKSGVLAGAVKTLLLKVERAQPVVAVRGPVLAAGDAAPSLTQLQVFGGEAGKYKAGWRYPEGQRCGGVTSSRIFADGTVLLVQSEGRLRRVMCWTG